MLSAKQGNYWYHFLLRLRYDAVLVGGLNPRPPALEASTLPPGYRGGGYILRIDILDVDDSQHDRSYG